MEEKDKEKFIGGSEELQQKYVNFTKEQLEQHEEFKLAGERLAGIEQGIEQKTIETVKKMLEKNLDLSLITDITGLEEEEIMKIKESN